MGKNPGVKSDFGSLPKRTNFPRVKFECGPIKIVVAGFGGPQTWQKSQSEIWVWGRQQCVVQERVHVKGQINLVNLFVSSF
jgi:hypothetical protein